MICYCVRCACAACAATCVVRTFVCCDCVRKLQWELQSCHLQCALGNGDFELNAWDVQHVFRSRVVDVVVTGADEGPSNAQNTQANSVESSCRGGQVAHEHDECSHLEVEAVAGYPRLVQTAHEFRTHER